MSQWIDEIRLTRDEYYRESDWDSEDAIYRRICRTEEGIQLAKALLYLGLDTGMLFSNRYVEGKYRFMLVPFNDTSHIKCPEPVSLIRAHKDKEVGGADSDWAVEFRLLVCPVDGLPPVDNKPIEVYASHDESDFSWVKVKARLADKLDEIDQYVAWRDRFVTA